MRLAFTVPADRRNLTGSESLTFTPDRPVADIVLRLWVNRPATAKYGARLQPTKVSADGMTSYALTSSDTLLRIRLRRAVPAGTTLHAAVRFGLRLPVGADDRLGTRPDATWWGTGFPLLSYVRGEGYATEPATSLFAETATSEEFRLADLAVTAPPGDTVLATGTPGAHQGRTWHFSASAVRDVAVATGQFRYAHMSAAGVPITVGVARDLPDNATPVAGVISNAVRDHVQRFGPFPFARLNIPVVPDVHGGIEYPGEIYLGTRQLDATPSHEVAHEWFYGLVGDDQARDPWLDEAFATYVEALDNGRADYYAGTVVPSAGRNKVGEPMTYWEKYGENTYFRAVYLQGATALINARTASGAAAFDRAIRCYVNAVAHRIARPADLLRALHGLPRAVDVLRRAGAFG
ncbi:MAG: M1 family aminopeptidase [Actinomycetes bacterium]